VGIVRLQAYPSPPRYGEPRRHRAAAALYLFAVHLIASTGSAFAINGFAGLTGAQILSFWLSFILFNGYVALEVASLAAFYFAARPRSGRPNPAAIWYFIAALLVVISFISTVWGAPAEKTFLDDSGTYLAVGTRTVKVFIGIGFAGVAVMCMLIGAVETARRKKAAQQTVVI
jgi:hypothetical protein